MHGRCAIDLALTCVSRSTFDDCLPLYIYLLELEECVLAWFDSMNLETLPRPLIHLFTTQAFVI